MRIVCLLLFLCLSAHAATYYIDATGGNNANNGTSSGTPWKTFANATNAGALPANSTVLLKSGETWSETFYMPTNGITLDAYGSGAAPSINQNGVTNRYGVLCGAFSNTIVQNITIKNVSGAAPPNDTGALWQTQFGSNTIQNCTLDTHFTDDNVAVDGGVAVVSNCIIINAGDQGVTMHNAGTAFILGCTISNCLEAFKNSTPSGQLTVNDCTILQNTLSDVDDLTGTVATFNRCKFNGRSDANGWSFMKANETNITFNYCLFDASHSSSGLAGPSFITQLAPVFLNNCVFYGNGIGTITVGTSQTLAATNCIFKDWWRAANLNSGASFLADHCIFTNITTGTRTESNVVSTGDPKFVSAATGNFHLQSGSPAIGTGLNIGLTLDLANNPVATPPSLGVYEYNLTHQNTITGGSVLRNMVLQ